MSEHGDVTLLHRKFELGENRLPTLKTAQPLKERVAFLEEELDELRTASLKGDLPGIADALVDLVVVAHGTAVQLGLPWQELWDDVQRANIEKVRGVGPRGNTIDLIKPNGWIGPRTEDILKRAGWSPVKVECVLCGDAQNLERIPESEKRRCSDHEACYKRAQS